MNISYYSSVLVIIVLFSMLFAGSAMAQESSPEPSMEQTVDWLLKNLPHIAKYRVSWGVPGTKITSSATTEITYSSINFQDCALSYAVQMADDPKPLPPSFSDLTKLNVTDVRDISFGELERSYKGKTATIPFFMKDSRPDRDVRIIVFDSPKTVSPHFHYTDTDMAKRMVSALRHLVTLCGGKPAQKEPF